MRARVVLFAAFTAAYFLSYFFRSANAVIAPDLAQELSLNAADLGLMTSLFFAGFTLVQIPVGVGLDRLGPRWVTPGLMLIAALGSLLFAVATGFELLAAGRALIGLGMGAVLMGALKAFSLWFSPRHFATLSGLLVGIGSSGALVAATPLAWLNQTVGWRMVFVAGTVITVLVAILIMVGTRNTPPGTAWHGTQHNGGTLLPTAVFADRRFWRLVPLSFFMVGTMYAFQGLWAGPYLFDVLRLTDIETGNVLLVLSIGAVVGAVAGGWLTDRLGVVRVITTSAAVFAICQFALVLTPPLAVVTVIYAIFGFTGAFNIMLLAHARQSFPPEMTGQAVTAVNTFGIGGVFALQWFIGVVVGWFPQDAGGHYPPEAYMLALSITAVGTALGLGWYIIGGSRAATVPVQPHTT